MAEADPKARGAAWARALEAGTLPPPVLARCADAGAGRVPWTSTMTPAELLSVRRHGIAPIATVSGTCWYMFGRSWTEGHAEGWRVAIGRMVAEAAAAGANAVVDVALRTVRPAGDTDGLAASGFATSMDFTVVGTAVRVAGLPPSPEPIIATVSTLEFVRLLEAGIVPVGVAIGAQYDWLTPSRFSVLSGAYATAISAPYGEVSTFWARIREAAVTALRADAARMGNGVLAHTHFGQILKQEPRQEGFPPNYLGRWIVVGTVVDTPARAGVPHDIAKVVDMRDDGSPLRSPERHRHGAYGLDTERDGAI